MPADKDTLLGTLAVERGYLTQARLDEAREAHRVMQEQLGVELPLIQVLLGKHLLTADQAQELRHAVAIQTGEASLVAGYEVVTKLGQGGFGVVYKARHLTTGRFVALKILPPSLADREFIARFEREARIVQKLDHPNIVGCVEFGYDPKRKVHFCALELIEGEDLGERLERLGGRPLAEDEAVSITYQIARALQHAHFNGLIHRDVKPENIMVTPDGTAKLLDLGLARRADKEATRLTESGATMGSPYYMSPEQANAEKEIDIRADIYALGATLYHMVTGRPPFEGGSVLVILHQHIHEQVTWPAEVNPLLSDGVCRVIARMMAKKPEERHQDPKEVLYDLDVLREGTEPAIADEAIKNSTVKLRGVGRGRRAVRVRQGEARGRRHGRAEAPAPEKKRPPFALVAGAAFAAAVVLGLGIFMLGGEKEPPRPARTGRGRAAGPAEAAPEPPPLLTGARDVGRAPPPPPARVADSAIALREAEQYEKANPDDLAGIIARYQAVSRDFPGVRQAGEAEISLARVRAALAARERAGSGDTLRADTGKVTPPLPPPGDGQPTIDTRKVSALPPGGAETTFQTAKRAPARFDAWTFFWVIPETDAGAELSYVVTQPDGRDYFRWGPKRLRAGGGSRSDFRKGLAGGDPGVFFDQHIRFTLRVSRGTMKFPRGAKFRFAFYRKGADGKIDWRKSIATVDAVVRLAEAGNKEPKPKFGGSLFGPGGGFERVTVRPGSRSAPMIVGRPVERAFGGRPYSRAFAVDGDPRPAVEVEGLPEWLAFDGKRTISGTPPEAAVGTRAEVTITARNAEGEDSRTFTISVEKPDLARGLVGWWKFDETVGAVARDSSGKGNDGRISGAKWAKGKIGGALSFDGRDDYVNVPGLSGWTPTAFSVCFWLDPTSVADWDQCIAAAGWWGQFSFHSGTGGAVWCGITGKWGRFANAELPAGTVAVGEWHHYAYTFDNGPAKFYKDGAELASGTHPMPATWTGFQIGTYNGDTINGRADDVRIYDRALAAAEVALLVDPDNLAAMEAEATTRAREEKERGALLDGFDALVRKGDYAGARKWMEVAARQPEHARSAGMLRAAARVAGLLEERRRAVRRAAEALVGAEAELETLKGRRKGKVEGVTDEGVQLSREIIERGRVLGQTTETVKWSDLAPGLEDELADAWKPQGADGAVARAYVALSRGDLDGAELALAEALGHALAPWLLEKIARVRADAAYLDARDRARACVAARDWKRAAEACEEALKLKPGDPEAKKLLAEAESHIGPPKTLTLDLGPRPDGRPGNVTMEFVYIKPGVFMMGGNEDPKHHWQGVEKPKHEVAITRGFYIGRYEVTRGEFAAFVKATGYRTEAEKEGKSLGRRTDGSWGEIAGVSWRDPVVFAQDDTHPVTCMSWNDVKAFCDWAAATTRRGVRLPTEAEWEFACRAGTTTRLSFGDSEGALGEYAWHDKNSGWQTHPVGQKRANAWGLHDMHGNVWEWVADRYDAGYYAKSPRENPAGPDSGRDRLLRGGGWRATGSKCRSAIRHHHSVYRPTGTLSVGVRACVSSSPRGR